MAHGKTGQAGTVTFGGSGFTGKLRRWRSTPTFKTVDDTGAGEGADSKLPLRLTWNFEAEGVCPAGATPPSGSALLGTESAIVAKIASTDTTPGFSGTGLVTEAEITSPYDDVATFTLRAECSTGAVPTNY